MNSPRPLNAIEQAERDQQPDTLVLFSGGMDSTISLYNELNRAKACGGIVHALTVDYGQRHKNETRFAQRIWSKALERYAPQMGRFIMWRTPYPYKQGSLLGGVPVQYYADDEAAEQNGEFDSAFVPYRNLFLLTIAATIAYELNALRITTGLRGGFEDCTAAYEMLVQKVLRASVNNFPLFIETPTHMTRAECLMLAKLIPGCWEALADTLTCFNGVTPPCGHCLPCIKRAAGFAAVEALDPILTLSYEDGVRANRPKPATEGF